jgi:hypothetical protein
VKVTPVAKIRFRPDMPLFSTILARRPAAPLRD